MWPSWFHPELAHRSPVERAVAVTKMIAAAHGLTIDDILGPSRQRRIYRVRCEVALYLRRRGKSYSQIGRFMNRHYSSVIQMVREAA